jgi:sirohydrochlorin cobaltochelatase
MQPAILLVGHGAPPKDYPADRVRRVKMLEGERRRKRTPITEEEKTLDAEVRAWPRTVETDPYQAGIERLAEALRAQSNADVYACYNEFCGPSVEAAIEHLYKKGFRHLRVLPTMFTPGGVHSEEEIPELLEEARTQYADLRIDYVWPFDLSKLAAMMLAEQAGR